MNKVYLNGQFIDEQEACISVYDRGFLFGDGVYEVIPVYAGELFLLNEHYQRLVNSLEAIGVPVSIQITDIADICNTLLKSAAPGEYCLYLQITRGIDDCRQHLPKTQLTPTIFLSLKKITPPLLENSMINVDLKEDIRWHCCDIKAITLLANVVMLQKAKEHGNEEIIMSRNKQVTEAASANVFIVSNNTLFTPPKNHLILAGITRDYVISLASSEQIEVIQKPISIDELYEADEIFLTNSTRGIMGVATVAGTPISDGVMGAMTAHLAQTYRHSALEHYEQKRVCID